MWASELIRRKRDGAGLCPEEIEHLIRGYVEGDVGDEQMAAFCMAVFFQGMSDEETSSLVKAMLSSGDTVDLCGIEGVKVDKHSTGGVGDKISICLAPLVAACGVPVPMMSGRALGHTGGTLDKLSAIPGFRTEQDITTYQRLVETHGLALIGQTPELAPADRRLYALRDVTATVESVPLIAASIMSKKLAEGIDALVLDVKVGSGAFMKTLSEAQALAEVLSAIGWGANKPTRVILTDMDRVLGRMVGNANETWEAIEVLQGGGPDDVRELTLILGAEMLILGQRVGSEAEGRTLLMEAIDSGKGFEKFQEVVAAQGGDPRAVEQRSGLPSAPHQEEIGAEQEGTITAIDAEKVGWAAMRLGAGRGRASDSIDLGVGIEMMADIGDCVKRGEVVARLSHRDGYGTVEARKLLQQALIITNEGFIAQRPLVLDRIEEGKQ